MKKTKRQLSAQYPALTADQVSAITTAWHALLDEQLPDGVIWLTAPFEREAGVWYLRAFLETRDKNISLDKCTDITRLLSDKTDSLPIPANCAYMLEISSPGLFRQLTTAKELAFYVGEPVRVTRTDGVIIDGTLTGFNADTQAMTLATRRPQLDDTDVSKDETPQASTLETITLAWTPDLTITLNYTLTHLEEIAND